MNFEIIQDNIDQNLLSKLNNLIFPLFNKVITSENFFYSVINLEPNKHYHFHHLELYKKIIDSSKYHHVSYDDTITLICNISGGIVNKSSVSILDARTIVFNKSKFIELIDSNEGRSIISSDIFFGHLKYCFFNKSEKIKDHKESFLEYILKQKFLECSHLYSRHMR